MTYLSFFAPQLLKHTSYMVVCFQSYYFGWAFFLLYAAWGDTFNAFLFNFGFIYKHIFFIWFILCLVYQLLSSTHFTEPTFILIILTVTRVTYHTLIAIHRSSLMQISSVWENSCIYLQWHGVLCARAPQWASAGAHTKSYTTAVVLTVEILGIWFNPHYHTDILHTTIISNPGLLNRL